MTTPPRALCAYLVVLVSAVALLLLRGVLTHGPFLPFVVLTALFFGGLTFVGERVTFRIAGIRHNLAASAHVATIALLPPPLPLLIALTTASVTQFPGPRAWYKKVFNVAHTTLVVGLPSLAYAALAPVGLTLRPVAFLLHLPAFLVLLTSYVVLDHVLLRLFFFLAVPPPRRVTRRDVLPEESVPAMLAELGALPFGLFGAMLYQVHPAFLLLLVTPIIVLYAAFRTTARHADTLAAHAATLGRRNVQLRTVVTTGQALRVQQGATDTLRRVAAGAQALSGAAAAAAYLCDPDDPTRLERVVLEPDDALNTGSAWLALPPAGRGLDEEPDDAGRTTVVVPVEVVRDGEGVAVVGALRLMGLDRALTDDDRDVLTLLATQAATALENTLLHARALAQASEDSLTGLLNHRAFQDRIEQEVARARRGGHPLAVVMIDLDGFGAINNVHGHQAGDVTLVAVARCLREQTRQADVAARYGGDEFTLILPETALDEALDTAERIRGELARLTVAHGAQAIRITASIGVAVMPDHATTREDLIGAADNASYAAKRAGKDRVRRAEAGALPHDPLALAARLDDANLATVEALASTVDAKDAYTRGHSGRVAAYAAAIAGSLGLPAADVARIRQAGVLHDVGKIGVPDAILLKPGQLSDEEFAVIKQHPEIGERILRGLPFLAEILPAVRHHHERWDGRGYPDGLAGDAIPHDAAILAVADSLDAMTSSRTYRVALLAAEAIRRVREGAGAQYDPRVVAAFDRAVADGTLALPPLRPGELWALPPRGDGAPARGEGVRAGVLRVVGVGEGYDAVS